MDFWKQFFNNIRYPKLLVKRILKDVLLLSGLHLAESTFLSCLQQKMSCCWYLIALGGCINTQSAPPVEGRPAGRTALADALSHGIRHHSGRNDPPVFGPAEEGAQVGEPAEDGRGNQCPQIRGDSRWTIDRACPQRHTRTSIWMRNAIGSLVRLAVVSPDGPKARDLGSKRTFSHG